MQSFTIGVRFSITVERAGVSDMSDWSNKLVERIKNQQQNKATEDAAFLERQRLKGTFGPSLWNEVIAETKKYCDEINAEAGDNIAVIQTTPQRWITVRGKTTRGVKEVTADFNPEQSILFWRSGSKSKQYEVCIGSNAKAAFYPLGDNGEPLITAPVAAQKIAQEMLDALLL